MIDDFDPFADLDALLDDSTETETARQLDRPKSHAHRAQKRQFVNGLKKQALTDLIPELPPPDTDLYVIGNGAGSEKKWLEGGTDNRAFDFGTFIPFLVEQLGNTACIAYISTWTMNRNHALSMIELLDGGQLDRLTVFTDPYFQRRESSVAAELITGIQRHPGRARYLAFKNHIKAMCIAAPGERQVVTVTGSANLSAQPRCEQYVLTTAPDVYRFFVTEFFEAMLPDG